MANQPRKEVAGGVVNGVNKVFTTTDPYLAGSVVGFLNGTASQVITELGGSSYEYEFPLLVGDVPAVYYIPA